MTTTKVPPATAVALPPPMSDADITAALRAAGATEEAGTSFNRAKLDGSAIVLGEEPFVGNPKTGTPALTVRLLSAPEEYQAFWFDEESAAIAGREGDSGFCKSYFDKPEQAREFSVDGHSCKTCPFNPFDRNATKRCQWKGDVQWQVLDPVTNLLDPEIWTMSLSTTSMIEFKGTSREPIKGSATDKNFYRKLAALAMANDIGIAQAITALRLGCVIAEIRVVRAGSSDGARTWSVVSFTPTQILELDEPLALPSGEDNGSMQLDDLPF